MVAKHSKFELLSQGSQAVVSLCSWMNALIDYHRVKMAVQPFKESLAEAEKTLREVKENTFIHLNAFSCFDYIMMLFTGKQDFC